MGRRLATCLIAAALLVSSLAAFADAGAGPTATASGQRTYAKFAFGRQYKPRTFRFGMSGRVTSMSWSKWGRKIARGRGIYQFNNCIPFCAAGTIIPTPASVVLTGREPCGTRFIFRRFKLYYAGQKTSGPSFCKK
jgi:hypothetical protein